MTGLRISNEPTPNFHQGIIAYPERTVAVAWVRDTALLAVALPRVIEFTPPRTTDPLTFVDVPNLALRSATATATATAVVVAATPALVDLR